MFKTLPPEKQRFRYPGYGDAPPITSDKRDWLTPDIVGFHATEEEIRIAEIYTALRPVGLDRWKPVLWIDVQSWVIADLEEGMPKVNAEWHCWQLAKALLTFLEEENES